MSKSEIIDELNCLCRELDAVDCDIIEAVVDAREDEGLPPFTPEEYAEAEKQCDENGQLKESLWDKIHALCNEYNIMTGKWPVYKDGIIAGYREPYMWED